jgi:hypothetical protein
MDEVYEPVSLGPSCMPKYQLCRHVYQKAFPDGSRAAFRRLLLKSRNSAFPRRMFDWQGSFYRTLIYLLENDFEGGFEHADLAVHQSFGPVNRRTASVHFHDFPKPADGVYTQALIDAHYERLRADYADDVRRMREHFQTPGPYLYVITSSKDFTALNDKTRAELGDLFGHETFEHLDVAKLERLATLLRRYSPDHRFRILYLERSDDPTTCGADWDDEARGFHRRALAPDSHDKRAADRWEGDDAAWDAVLSEFPLGLHDPQAFTRRFPVARPLAFTATARMQPPLRVGDGPGSFRPLAA